MRYNIGVGKYDITGPSLGVGFMGMSKMSQQGEGLLNRLFARSFVIEDKLSNKSVIIIVADLAIISQAVKNEVSKRVMEYAPFKINGIPVYNSENILLAANHTHSGPGGYSHYMAYNASIGGFNEQNYECIIDGIFQSIRIAHESKQAATIRIACGEVRDCGYNRSLNAYKNNQNSNLSQYPNTEDREMLLLRFDDGAGTPFGSINWFALHPTNLGENSKLVSSDNKGYAQYMFERTFPGVVSAFANSCCGDISPNIKEIDSNGNYVFAAPDGVHDIQRCMDNGKRQFERSFQLFTNATEVIEGEIDFRHAYVDMNQCQIQGTGNRTWSAALGYGMVNGSSEDSKGLKIKKWGEGTTKTNFQYEFVPGIEMIMMFSKIIGVKWPSKDEIPIEYINGHEEKPILFHLGLGRYRGNPLVPNVLPLQMIRIGNMILVAHPGEMTTMAGRKMRQAIQETLGVEYSKKVVIATYANAYSSYTTTREEYAKQQYEGASMLFGPWTFSAYVQENIRLAKALKDRKAVDQGPVPIRVALNKLYKTPRRSVRDFLFPGLQFGQIYEDVNASYKKGDVVKFTLLSGNPNNDLLTMGSYTKVERKKNGIWEKIYDDNDWCTNFRCQMIDRAYFITVVWDTKDSDLGKYRLRYSGHWKELGKGNHPITSISREFDIK